MSKDSPHLKKRENLVESRELILNMSALMRALEVNAKGFERDYGINRRLVSMLVNDNWREIKHHELRLLMSLAHRTKLEYPFLDTVEHPLWATFGQPTNGYVGEDLDGSAVKEDWAVITALRNADVKLVAERRPGAIPEMMKTMNTIFVGSPKRNPFVEQALEMLFPKHKPPFKFQRPEWSGVTGRRFVQGGSEIGIEYLHHKGAKRVLAIDGSNKDGGKQRPAGVLVACRKPGTDNDVTTLIIAGCTVAGTNMIAQDLLDGRVFLPPNALKNNPGKPFVFVLSPTKTGADWYSYDCAEALSSRKAGDKRR